MEDEARFVKVETTMGSMKQAIEQMQRAIEQMAAVITEQARNQEQIKTLFRIQGEQGISIQALETKTSDMKEQCAKNHGKPDPDHDKVVENSKISDIVIKILVGVGLLVAGIVLGKGI